MGFFRAFMAPRYLVSLRSSLGNWMMFELAGIYLGALGGIST